MTLFQSDAKVTFSDILIISFGKRENPDDDISLDSKEPAEDVKRELQNQLLSCPTLKFRIANELHAHRRGEIIDARLNAVATIDANNCILGKVQGQKVFSDALRSESVRSGTSSSNAITTVVQKGMRASEFVLTSATQNAKKISTGITSATQNVKKISTGISNVLSHKQSKKLSGLAQYRMASQYFPPHSLNTDGIHSDQSERGDLITTDRDTEHEIMGELNQDLMVQDETNVDKPNLVFTKISFEPSYHPFFKSTWNVSHR